MKKGWCGLLLVAALAGCEEDVTFRGDWECVDKKARPTWTFEARVIGPDARKVFADPVYKNLVTVGTVELEKVDGNNWEYVGKLPTALEFGVDVFGQEVGFEEDCKDVSSVLYQVVFQNGESQDFQVKRAKRGDKIEL